MFRSWGYASRRLPWLLTKRIPSWTDDEEGGRINKAEGKGFVPSTRYRANTGFVTELDAESDALFAVDPQLAEVAAMWSKLTEEQRLQIVNIVRETS